MKFTINWIKTPNGNGIREGSQLKIHAARASHISGAIYRKGFPVLAIFGMGENAKILVKRKGLSLKGQAVCFITEFE